jgi:hypothetical protein
MWTNLRLFARRMAELHQPTGTPVCGVRGAQLLRAQAPGRHRRAGAAMTRFADRDRLADQVAVLLDAPRPVLRRALAAVAVAHSLDDEARCRCRTGRAVPPVGCPTRQALWTAIGEVMAAGNEVRE